ncbi:gliding motility-associated ABC transporter permease subunit GldF [Cyclobacterium marinum]|uniref:Gliding motility-associated ABC transporter permease protein GldF n=1 Tax=Cyclobacterium marinum (strain ATCC 25205 / DSM 745 / LMG 13164 / NCIMB 1802) TaxID=880070 RepID=G0IZF6_CYCMS|nr:gliding motility-associated ABC transporter permease subunit GldF [Cyclobacterium marinum]AEL24429.1 gliding motility-associated ABC transporter permease protein GldF [Cyclobacterium marinum DSM 745]MBR9773475.1 gliding motility-associated ABC transporter permease subunit GldF [Cytophagales bacterium]|tara:strand:+ start:11733 stop:12455 length:723 start_codon:yes stop_codon:yes gene_type:complete
MLSLFKKEVNAFFSNLSAYLITAVFLVSLGLIVWVFPGTSVLDYGYADLEPLFSYTPFVFIFLLPAITMRMVAEEKKSGTWELLKTSPLKNYQIVLAKYLAALVLLVFSLIPTLVYYFSIFQLGDTIGNIDSAGFFGAYIGLFLVGALFASVGLFSSSISSNQIVSFVIAVFLSFLLYGGIGALATLATGDQAVLLQGLGADFHYEQMGRGVIVSENIYYFIGMILTFLVCSWVMINKDE